MPTTLKDGPVHRRSAWPSPGILACQNTSESSSLRVDEWSSSQLGRSCKSPTTASRLRSAVGKISCLRREERMASKRRRTSRGDAPFAASKSLAPMSRRAFCRSSGLSSSDRAVATAADLPDLATSSTSAPASASNDASELLFVFCSSSSPKTRRTTSRRSPLIVGVCVSPRSSASVAAASSCAAASSSSSSELVACRWSCADEELE
mmetsp:Transcript_21600/g.66580  ORF Transcript_21600/g.66580 Transcript_21600/m.66580 type:complete len:207 (-) Transcript_21600:213-833(-)